MLPIFKKKNKCYTRIFDIYGKTNNWNSNKSMKLIKQYSVRFYSTEVLCFVLDKFNDILNPTIQDITKYIDCMRTDVLIIFKPMYQASGYPVLVYQAILAFALF